MPTINTKHIETKIGILNRATKSPETPCTRDGNKYLASVGCFYLDETCGYYNLLRIQNEKGGSERVFTASSKREFAGLIDAYLRGYELAKGVV
jgi:hypothetical protein